MKRFWREVTIGAGDVLLDGRTVRTPARAVLNLPTPALAEAVAEEWRAVGDRIDPRTMPLTGLANAAIDRPVDAVALATYAATDLLCYRSDTPPDLVAAQAEAWDPLIAWAQTRYDVSLRVTAGIVPVAQPAETLARLAAAVTALGPFHRTALFPVVAIGGSLIAALAVLEGHLTGEDAFDATHLDELWQARLWGEDTLAAAAREARRGDYLAAVRMLALLALEPSA